MSDLTGRRDDPVPIAGLIDSVLGRLARPDIAPVVRLRLDWDRVAGQWSTRCRPVGLRDGVLTVVVASGLDATRLRYDAAGLVDRADATLDGDPPVSAIAIRVGRGGPSSSPPGGSGAGEPALGPGPEDRNEGFR